MLSCRGDATLRGREGTRRCLDESCDGGMADGRTILHPADCGRPAPPGGRSHNSFTHGSGRRADTVAVGTGRGGSSC